MRFMGGTLTVIGCRDRKFAGGSTVASVSVVGVSVVGCAGPRRGEALTEGGRSLLSLVTELFKGCTGLIAVVAGFTSGLLGASGLTSARAGAVSGGFSTTGTAGG